MTTQGVAASLRPSATGTGCTGEGCTTREPWPLHHVKHRGVYVRLCTACVLKYHPSLFCSLCLDLIQPDDSISAHSNANANATTSSPLIHCSSCHNVCHASCLPPCSSSSSTSTSTDFFLCPSCSSSTTAAAAAAASTIDALNPSSSASRRRTVDLTYARSILCAARLSAQSMNRAASAARADADRKAKEAAAARKRAREMLERVAVVAKMEKDRRDKEEQREKEQKERETEKGKGKGGVVAGGGREREKWMRFHEMIPSPSPFHDKDKPLAILPPNSLPLRLPLPAAKFEQDDAKGLYFLFFFLLPILFTLYLHFFYGYVQGSIQNSITPLFLPSIGTTKNSTTEPRCV